MEVIEATEIIMSVELVEATEVVRTIYVLEINNPMARMTSFRYCDFFLKS